MMIVGQYLSVHDIAIFGIGFSFYAVVGVSIPIGFGCGVDLLCSQATGKGRLDLAGEWMQTALVVTMFICIPSMVVFLFFSGAFLGLFFEEVLARDLGTFMMYCTPYVLLQAWNLTLSRALQAQQRADVPTFASFCSAVVCVVVAIKAIPAYGVNSAPLCLTLAMVVQLVVTFIYAFIDGETIVTRVETWNPLNISYWKKVASLERMMAYSRIGFFAMLSIVSEWWAIEALSLLSSLLAEKQIAALGVCWILITLFFNVPLSASVASSSFVGNNLGANKPLHAEYYSCVVQTVNAVLLLCNSLFLAAFGHWWFALFTSDVETLQVIYQSINALILFHNLEGWHISIQGIMRGCAKEWLNYTAKVVGISLWLISIPASYFYAINPPSFIIMSSVDDDEENRRSDSGVSRLFLGFCVGFVFELAALIYAWRCKIPWSDLALEASKHHDEEEIEAQEEVENEAESDG